MKYDILRNVDVIEEHYVKKISQTKKDKYFFLSYMHLFLNLVCVRTQERSGHQSSKEHGKEETSGEKKGRTRTTKWWNSCGLKADRTICRAVMGPARAHKGTEQTDGLMGAHRDQGDCRVSAYMLWLSSLEFPTVGVWGSLILLPTCGVLFFLLGCLIHPWRDGMCLILL